MRSEAESGGFPDFIEALFRNRALLLISCTVIVGASLGYAVLAKPQYDSEMKILVQNTRATTVVGGDSGGHGEVMSSDMMESQINSEVELLQSSDLISSVLEYRDNVLHKAPLPAPGSIAMAQQMKIVGLSIDVIPIRKTNMIQVSYMDSDPRSAQQSLEWLSTQFLRKHATIRRPAGTYKFFEGQARAAEANLDSLQAALIAFDRANGITSLEQERQLDLEKLSADVQEGQQIDASIRADQARLDHIKSEQDITNERITTEVRTGANAESISHLDTMLVDLEQRSITLGARYKADDPEVLDNGRKMANIQAELARLEKDQNAQTTQTINPISLVLSEDAAKTAANLSAEKARLGSLQKSTQAYESRLSQLQLIDVEHDQLERKIEEARDNLKKFTEQRDNAQIEDQLDQSKIVDVAVADQPTFSIMPVRPRRKMILILGATLSLFVSIGIIFVKEATRETIYTARELARACSAPMLATIQQTSLPMESLALSGLPLQPRLDDAAISGLRRAM